MNRELKQLNFKELLQLHSSINLETYDVEACRHGNGHLIHGFCLKCENSDCNVSPKDPAFSLKNISHGASSDDVLCATGKKDLNFSDWHNEAVLFLMEGPSKDYDIYQEVEFNGYKKCPTKGWYWIHDGDQSYSYPNEFKGRTYGGLFSSIIFTFKLKNAYLTNLVKCGLNNAANAYKGIDEYNPKCVQTCYENYLQREILILKPQVVFCFGSKVYNFLWRQYENEPFPWRVMPLPHPSGGRRGFRDDFFRHLYYSMILEGLYEAGIIKIDEAKEKYGEFLKLSKRHND